MRRELDCTVVETPEPPEPLETPHGRTGEKKLMRSLGKLVSDSLLHHAAVALSVCQHCVVVCGHYSVRSLNTAQSFCPAHNTMQTFSFYSN